MRRVELDNMIKICITDFLLLATKFCKINDGNGCIQSELFILVSAESLMGLLKTCQENCIL